MTSAPKTALTDKTRDNTVPGMPDVVDQVALARLYGEPLFALPHRPVHPARRA
jgi:hypothetical protein